MSTILSIGVYLLESYAIYRLAIIRNLPNPIFAFIPFFQLFMLGQIGDSLKYLNPQVNSMFGNIPLSYALPLISIAQSLLRYPFSGIANLVLALSILSVIPVFGAFFGMAGIVLGLASILTPVVGPLLILYSIRGRRW